MTRRSDDGPTPETSSLIREARALGIPWEEILEAEIRAERLLARARGIEGGDPPLEVILALLPFSALGSWRIRDLIERLSWKARPGSGDGREARRNLRAIGRWLLGGVPSASAPALAGHLLLAYLRIQELIAICQAASRARGSTEERIELVCARTRCAAADTRWALDRSQTSKTPMLEDCVRKAREEGFEIPSAGSAPETVLALREHLERRGLLKSRTPKRVPSTGTADG